MPMLVVLYAAAFVSAFNENIINVALIDIMGTFSVASTTAQWLVTGYMIVTSIIVTLMAYLMQRFTHRQLFFGAAIFFIVGEFGCMLATSFPLLLVLRLIQAVGSGVFIPLMMTSVLALAPKERMGTYLSIGSAAITLGPALAPVLSGVAVTYFGWRTIFVLPTVVVIVLVVAAIPLMHNLGERTDAKLDIASVLLAIVGLTLFVYGLGEITTNLVVSLVTLAIAIVAIGIFARRQDHLDQPVLSMRPMKNSQFAIACVLVVVTMMMSFSMSVLLPLYFEGAFGQTALVAGVLILPAIAVNAGTAVIGGNVMDRRGAWPLFPIGFGLVAVGQVAIALVSGSLALVAVVVFSVFVYGGVGLVMSPSQTAGLSSLSREDYPDGVSIINTLVMVSASIGPSLFIGIMSSGTDAVTAAGLSAAAAQASGFARAMIVAAAIAAAGFILATWYARRITSEKYIEKREEAAPSLGAELAPSLSFVMERDPYYVREGATVREAALIMVNKGTSGVPVIDEDRHVVGFVSDGDIMRALSSQKPADFDLGLYVVNTLDESYQSNEAFKQRLEELMNLPVMDLATKNVVTINVSTSFSEVFDLLRANKFKKVPVLFHGKLAGTVSRNSVVRYMMGVLAEEGVSR